jgi:hypothetical protein
MGYHIEPLSVRANTRERLRQPEVFASCLPSFNPSHTHLLTLLTHPTSRRALARRAAAAAAAASGGSRGTRYAMEICVKDQDQGRDQGRAERPRPGCLDRGRNVPSPRSTGAARCRGLVMGNGRRPRRLVMGQAWGADGRTDQQELQLHVNRASALVGGGPAGSWPSVCEDSRAVWVVSQDPMVCGIAAVSRVICSIIHCLEVFETASRLKVCSIMES